MQIKSLKCVTKDTKDDLTFICRFKQGLEHILYFQAFCHMNIINLVSINHFCINMKETVPTGFHINHCSERSFNYSKY